MALKEITDRLDTIIQILRKEDIFYTNTVLDAAALLSLPIHLRDTAVAVLKNGPSTAQDIANITKKARAVESGYLNQLTVMKLLVKRREGRKMYFEAKGR